MTVRRVEFQDLEQLAVLLDQYRVFYEQTSDVAAARVFLTERILNKESVIFVDEAEDGILTGFCQLFPLFSSVHLSRVWLLNDLFVKSTHRGLGIGVALLEEAKKLCIDTMHSELLLETAKSNVVGNRLYPKCGFVLDEEYNHYAWKNPRMPDEISSH